MTASAIDLPEVTRKQELVLYDIVDRRFELNNIYALGGIRPNAKFIACQYDVKIEFRHSQFRQVGRDSYSPNYLARWGISDDNSCLSAVLIGDDREKLVKARDDIRRSHGCALFECGEIDISDKKSFLST